MRSGVQGGLELLCICAHGGCRQGGGGWGLSCDCSTSHHPRKSGWMGKERMRRENKVTGGGEGGGSVFNPFCE